MKFVKIKFGWIDEHVLSGVINNHVLNDILKRATYAHCPSGTLLVRLYNWIFANCMIAGAHDKTVDVLVCV